MLTKIDGLSEHDRVLEDELNKCNDAYRCHEIAEQAENGFLAMEANRKSIRLYREEEYSEGML
jgi:hypothetical protein